MGHHDDRWAIVHRTSDIRPGDLFMFGVDDFDDWTDLAQQPNPAGGVMKRFLGIDEHRGVIIFECDNPPMRMETGLNRITFAHRVVAMASSKWQLWGELWRLRINGPR
jgi:hypothetical protein